MVAVSWLIAHSYAVSHTRAILGSLGLSVTPKGSHLVSLPIDTALVHYAGPLAVALVCGYGAHRLVLRVREAVDVVRARSVEAQRDAAPAREAAKAGNRDARAPRPAGQRR
jgi:hypothetical protein